VGIKKSVYYKCILCGVYGGSEEMYNHLSRGTHTNNYINNYVIKRHVNLTMDQKEKIIHTISRKDGWDLNRIKIYYNKELYPIKWEEEGISKQSLISRTKK